jgi:DNA-binding XRE family transcriptional regulator
MGILEEDVSRAARMMTHAEVMHDGIEITFADGCKGVIPFPAIPEVKNPSDLERIELPDPYQIIIHGQKGELVELPWDFVRHYCDASYQPVEEKIAAASLKSLGKHIRFLRENAGLTQLKLAEAAGIGRVTELRIENGEQSPRFDTLAAIARALKCSIVDIIASESERKSNEIQNVF